MWPPLLHLLSKPPRAHAPPVARLLGHQSGMATVEYVIAAAVVVSAAVGAYLLLGDGVAWQVNTLANAVPIERSGSGADEAQANGDANGAGDPRNPAPGRHDNRAVMVVDEAERRPSDSP